MPEQQAPAKAGVVPSIRRVIRHSGCSPRQFYWGLALRVLDRCFEVLPFLVCYLWVAATLWRGEPTAPGDAAQASFGALLVERLRAAMDGAAYQDTIWVFSLVLLAMFLCQLCCAWLGQRQSFEGSYRIMAGYRERLIDRVRRLPLGRLYQYRAGQLADVLTDDVKRVEAIFTHIAAEVFSAAVVPVLMLMGLLWVDWRLALSLVAGLPLAIWALNCVKRFFTRVGTHKQETLRETAGMLVEFVSGLKTLRLFNRTNLWLSRLNRQFDNIRKASMGLEAWAAGPVVSYRLLLELSLVVLLVVCASLAGGDLGTAGLLDTSAELVIWLLFLLFAYKLLGPLLEVAEYLTILRYAAQCEFKIQELFAGELLCEPQVPVSPSEYDIRFESVSFGYDDEPVLHNVSFAAPPNGVTAIVGPSGAGKSSVMNLLARFYDPERGTVSIGGCDLKAIGTDRLYQHVSMVFQQVQLYDGSIMENIRTGRPNASDREVFAACEAANCDHFIRQLPAGYHTQVGEGGARLSGGERQRLSIARALLKNAPVLLLDEATASVDPDAQYEIQHALSRLATGRTVIMIAHRLSTVKNADQVLVMDRGRIVERGDHCSLLASGGLYKTLWDAQTCQDEP